MLAINSSKYNFTNRLGRRWPPVVLDVLRRVRIVTSVVHHIHRVDLDDRNALDALPTNQSHIGADFSPQLCYESPSLKFHKIP